MSAPPAKRAKAAAPPNSLVPTFWDDAALASHVCHEHNGDNLGCKALTVLYCQVRRKYVHGVLGGAALEFQKSPKLGKSLNTLPHPVHLVEFSSDFGTCSQQGYAAWDETSHKSINVWPLAGVAGMRLVDEGAACGHEGADDGSGDDVPAWDVRAAWPVNGDVSPLTWEKSLVVAIQSGRAIMFSTDISRARARVRLSTAIAQGDAASVAQWATNFEPMKRLVQAGYNAVDVVNGVGTPSIRRLDDIAAYAHRFQRGDFLAPLRPGEESRCVPWRIAICHRATFYQEMIDLAMPRPDVILKRLLGTDFEQGNDEIKTMSVPAIQALSNRDAEVVHGLVSSATRTVLDFLGKDWHIKLAICVTWLSKYTNTPLPDARRWSSYKQLWYACQALEHWFELDPGGVLCTAAASSVIVSIVGKLFDCNDEWPVITLQTHFASSNRTCKRFNNISQNGALSSPAELFALMKCYDDVAHMTGHSPDQPELFQTVPPALNDALPSAVSNWQSTVLSNGSHPCAGMAVLAKSTSWGQPIRAIRCIHAGSLPVPSPDGVLPTRYNPDAYNYVSVIVTGAASSGQSAIYGIGWYKVSRSMQDSQVTWEAPLGREVSGKMSRACAMDYEFVHWWSVVIRCENNPAVLAGGPSQLRVGVVWPMVMGKPDSAGIHAGDELIPIEKVETMRTNRAPGRGGAVYVLTLARPTASK